MLSLHFSELVCVKMVIFTKFWVEGWLTILSYFFTAFVIYKPLEPSLWFYMGVWELFEDVGDLAEIFFVGVGGTFEDGGLRDYLFAN